MSLAEGQDADVKRSGVVIMSDPKSPKSDSDGEFVSQAAVSALLRGALLELLQSRPEDPVGFLAEHFAHLSAEAEDGGAEHRSVSRGLWHLSLAHHSHRSRQLLVRLYFLLIVLSHGVEFVFFKSLYLFLLNFLNIFIAILTLYSYLYFIFLFLFFYVLLF